ncbi:MAG: molybdenum cofactor guanylyltransferase [Spirochaetes bacterium]|nr:molybdenum cofactor guanylyltransferase [Spirochaetota bacterium]
MDFTAFIIAGGRSSRFGEDKALFHYRGKTLLEHVIGTIRPAIPHIAVIADLDGKYDIPGVPCYGDLVPGYGPLGGLHAALHRLERGSAFLFPCDMPYLNEDLIRYMMSASGGFDVTVPYYGGYYQPLHAIYSPHCIGPVERCIEKNLRRIIAFYDDVTVRRIREDEIRGLVDPYRAFRNINFRRDLDGETMEKLSDERPPCVP